MNNKLFFIGIVLTLSVGIIGCTTTSTITTTPSSKKLDEKYTPRNFSYPATFDGKNSFEFSNADLQLIATLIGDVTDSQFKLSPEVNPNQSMAIKLINKPRSMILDAVLEVNCLTIEPTNEPNHYLIKNAPKHLDCQPRYIEPLPHNQLFSPKFSFTLYKMNTTQVLDHLLYRSKVNYVVGHRADSRNYNFKAIEQPIYRVIEQIAQGDCLNYRIVDNDTLIMSKNTAPQSCQPAPTSQLFLIS